MNERRVSYVFFFAVVMTVVADDELLLSNAEVSIWDTTVTLTCPYKSDDGSVKWYHNKKEVSETESYNIDNYNEKNDGLYYCKKDLSGTPHYFFIKAKVCKQCIDLNISMAMLIVFADVCFTLLIVYLVYYCTQKKSGTATPQRSTDTRHQRPQARGPPPPDRDYQPLNMATRNYDVYATANLH